MLCFLAFSPPGCQDTTLSRLHFCPILLWTPLSSLSSWPLLPGSPPPLPAEYPRAPENLTLPSRLGPRPLLPTPEWPHQAPGRHILMTPRCVCHALCSLIFPACIFTCSLGSSTRHLIRISNLTGRNEAPDCPLKPAPSLTVLPSGSLSNYDEQARNSGIIFQSFFFFFPCLGHPVYQHFLSKCIQDPTSSTTFSAAALLQATCTSPEFLH